MFLNSPSSTQDISVLWLEREAGAVKLATPELLLHTPAAEVDPDLSHDGRWLTYASNESGRSEAYVRPFPDVNAGRTLISTDSGSRPVFARNGRELFYLDANGLLTGVPVQTSGTAFRSGSPVQILKTRYYPGFTGLGLDLRGYDVSPDGQRFLMIKEGDTGNRAPAPTTINVVVNWSEELKARLPAQ